ncbi:hypothetical protein AAVH_27983 [Aphelenchoides avenae]|nr:hypothetical protein AAVH_27983 [Aphelenchus avenae]
MIPSFAVSLLPALCFWGTVIALREYEPGYTREEVWAPRAERISQHVEKLLGEDIDLIATRSVFLKHKLNATFKLPNDDDLVIGSSVLLGRTCPEGVGARGAVRIEFVADYDMQELIKFDPAKRTIISSWNPTRLTFHRTQVVVENAVGDEKVVNCAFHYSTEGSRKVYRMLIISTSAGRPCVSYLHVPSWVEADLQPPRDLYLHQFQSIPAESEHFAHEDVWLPRAENYLRNVDKLLGIESHRDPPGTIFLNKNVNVTFYVPKESNMSLVLMPLEGRTCVGGRGKGGISRVTIHDARSDCEIYVAVTLEYDDYDKEVETVHTTKESLIFSWNPVRLMFNGEHVEASNAKGRRRVQRIQCSFTSEDAGDDNVFRLWFERGYNFDGTECANLMLLPPDIRFDVLETKGKASSRPRHSEL